MKQPKDETVLHTVYDRIGAGAQWIVVGRLSLLALGVEYVRASRGAAALN